MNSSSSRMMTTDEPTTAREEEEDVGDEEGTMMSSSSSTYSPLTNNNDTPFSLFGGVQNQQSYNSSANSNNNNNLYSNNSNKKATRINWSKSPHRERLHEIINDWYTQSGMAIDTITNEPITDYKVYASKVGIPKTTLFRYIHKDPSKRRLVIRNNTNDTDVVAVVNNNNNEDCPEGGVVDQSNEGGGVRGQQQQHVQLNDGQRGRKRLIDDRGIKFIVGQLKAKTNVNPSGFSRNEAIDVIMEHFDISRTAASRQLTRHVLPELAKVNGQEYAEQQQQQQHQAVIDMREIQQQQHQPPQQTRQQPKRSIVISGVTSGFGRALFQYYYNNGHDVAGCGGNANMIQSMQLQYPNSKLSTVDVSNNESVSQWTIDLEQEGMKFDLIIATTDDSGSVCPEMNRNKPMWEISCQDFDTTIDVNVKGVSNMIRAFIPRMIRYHCGDASVAVAGGGGGQGISTNGGGVFVAMSSSLGRSPHPYHAAYCASKFALEGLMKSVAMSLPRPLSAVPLAPGVVARNDNDDTDTAMQCEHLSRQKCSKQQQLHNDVNNEKDINQWVNAAGPMILRMNRNDNGKSMSVKDFYSVRDRQGWIIQDGTGIPN